MNLRVRILLGYGYLFALLLASAAGAAFGFHKLGQAIGLAAEPLRGSKTEAQLQEARQAMITADENAQAFARQQAIVHALLVTVALFSLGFLSREMQRLVLDRLDELKTVAKAIAAGQRRRRVSVVREDELGFVARQLNAALDAQEDAEAEMQGRLAQQRQLLLALLEARGRPSIVITFSGELVASTLDAGETAEAMQVLAGARASGELETPKGGARLRRKRFKLDAGERQLAVRLLEAPEERLVGWLASFEPKDDGRDDEDDDSTSERN